MSPLSLVNWVLAHLFVFFPRRVSSFFFGEDEESCEAKMIPRLLDGRVWWLAPLDWSNENTWIEL